MSEPIRKQYKKAGPNDKRHVTSKSNLQKARQRKLEMLRKGKEKEKEETRRFVSESESDIDSDSSDDSDYIVITPKNKKPKEKPKKSSNNEDGALREELNQLKQMLTKKKRAPRKKQVIQIVNPAPTNSTPIQQPVKDADMDYFKKLLLSQLK